MEKTDAYYPIDSEATVGCAGISVRDKLAESAMISILSNLPKECDLDSEIEYVCQYAYKIADSMIKQSNL